MRPLVLLLAFALPASATERAFPAPRATGHLAIEPPRGGKHLPTAVSAVLDAARTCTRRGSLHEIPATEANDVAYFAAELENGEPATPTERTVEWTCDAHPVERCRFQYAWVEDLPELSYATVECTGSESDPEASFTVASIVDVPDPDGRRRRDAGVRHVSVVFTRTGHPGAQVFAWGRFHRDDDRSVDPVRVQRFDDRSRRADEDAHSVAPDLLLRLSEDVRALACRGVGRTDCRPR